MGCIAFESLPSSAFLHATEYSFDPAPSDERRRRDRSQLLLGKRLCDIYGRLPLELWLQVAGELVRECAISTAQTLWQHRSSADRQVDIELGVWASYVCIDGVRYIADLSNAVDSRSSSAMILHVCKTSEINVVYSLEDHLGIRRLVFASQEDTAKPPSFPGSGKMNGLWWQTIPLRSRKLEAKSDVSYRPCPLMLFSSHSGPPQGLKLRSLESGSSTEKKETKWLWPSPMSQPQRALLSFWRFAPESYPSVPDHVRMVSVPCNRPELTGYSVCLAGNVMLIHAHSDGEEHLSLYDDSRLRSHAIWLYMPMDPDERISEIWARRGKQHPHMGLAVRLAFLAIISLG